MKLERIDTALEGLYLLVSPPFPLAREHSAFEGEAAFERRGYGDRTAGATAISVHVISVHAGGQVRGYFLIEGGLHKTLPDYVGDWPEIDAATAAALRAAGRLP